MGTIFKTIGTMDIADIATIVGRTIDRYGTSYKQHHRAALLINQYHFDLLDEGKQVTAHIKVNLQPGYLFQPDIVEVTSNLSAALIDARDDEKIVTWESVLNDIMDLIQRELIPGVTQNTGRTAENQSAITRDAGEPQTSLANYYKEHELIFNGTPRDFRRIAEWFADRHRQTNPNANELWHRYSYREEIDTSYISFERRFDRNSEWADAVTINGYAEAFPAPGGKARIQVYAQFMAWITLQETWKSLEDELRRQGWIDDQGQKATPDSEREPVTAIAKRLKRHPKRVARWYRILDSYLPQGLTQEQIADEEDKDVETIKDDYRDMRKAGLFPLHSHP